MRQVIVLLSNFLFIVLMSLMTIGTSFAEQRINPWAYPGRAPANEGVRPWANIPPGQQQGRSQKNRRFENPAPQYYQPYPAYPGFSGGPYQSPNSGWQNPYGSHGFSHGPGGFAPYPGLQGGDLQNSIYPYMGWY